MAQSPEYPDLPWMPPRSWTDANRTAVQLVVIHVTDGAARSSAAEDGAAYDQRRFDGTSTHYFHDSNSTIQCVRTADQAHAARAQGNKRGIQHELCTRADAAVWSDDYHQAMLRRAAKQAVRDAKKWDIPVRHLTVAQVAAGVKGFCGHVDITHAFPQDHGTHTDPGPNFPWSQFLDLVRDELEEDDMPTAEEIADAVWAKADKAGIRNGRTIGGTLDALAVNSIATVGAVRELAAKDAVDEQALVAALAPAVAGLVLAGLPADTPVTPEQLQAAIVGALRELAAPAA